MPTYQPAPNCKLYYYDSPTQSAKPVLLLHGLGATADSWGLQTPVLEDAGFRVIAPDTRGFGRSNYPHEKTRISVYAADVAGLARHTAIQQVDVVGISMGGTIALQLALDHPDLVRRLVLINTFASLRPDRPSVWVYFAIRFALMHTLGLESQARFVARRIFPAENQAALRQVLYDQVCQADLHGYRAAMRALALFDVTRRLGEIRCPVLVITAENDTTVTPPNQAKLVQGIPGARQVFIPGAGHAVTADQPALVNSHILDFLNQETRVQKSAPAS